MKNIIYAASASALMLLAAGQAVAGTDRSAAWQAQIGDTSTVQTTANGGAGIVIAIVDTGVVSTNAEISGRVSGLSRCAAVTFTCSNGFYDDNGHGTAVASIAAGRYSSTANISMSGVAPAATILADKVLNRSGSGYDSDVANGIITAANSGAHVINLSLTYIPSTKVINAINYAASKNVVMVWAGGNSGTSFNGGANTTGLTTAALARTIFVGSVGSTNVISGFSNRPGTGKAYAGSTWASYSSMWLMANGENILAPAIQFGSTYYANWSGTSMAAPEVAGAVALLEATWPVLIRDGTAPAILFRSAKDLGATGVDNTYGNGLLNIAKAFEPIGSLSVTTTSGTTTTVSGSTTTLVTSSAVGSMPALRGRLSDYTTFDDYSRDFRANLSGLVGQAPAGGLAAALTPSTRSIASVRQDLPGGGFVAVAASRASFAGDAAVGGPDPDERLFPGVDRGATAMTLVNSRGDLVSFSRGMSPTAAFSQALWGADAPAAEDAGRLGVSTSLMSLAQGGYASSVGAGFGRARLAFGWSSTDQRYGVGLPTDRTRSTARAAMMGLSARITARWTIGAAYTTLSERNGLLGSTYDGAGLLSLGADRASRAVSVTSAVDLGGGRTLVADAAWTQSDAATVGGGLVRDVSALTARAYGVSLSQADAFRAGDHLTLSVRKPLRVTAGTLSLAETSVDGDGYAHTTFAPVSLVPDGNETDVDLAYAARLGRGVTLGGQVSLRSDVMNMRGRKDAAARLDVTARF